MAWLAKLEREDWSFRFVLIDVIDKTELTEWTEFRLVNCQRLDSVDSVNSVRIHEERAKQSKGSAIGLTAQVLEPRSKALPLNESYLLAS